MNFIHKEIFQDFTNRQLVLFVKCAQHDGNIYNKSFFLAVEELDARIEEFKKNDNDMSTFLNIEKK